MAHTITVAPSGITFAVEAEETILAAGIRQGIAMPYGCKDGTCGTCKCKKLGGIVTHGPHLDKALSAAEETDGMVLTCCATPLADVQLESKQVTAQGTFPIKKMPARVSSLKKVSHDAIVLRLQVPAVESFQYHAGQYIEILLKDGERRAYSMASAPETQASQPGIELHLRHMPGGKFTDQVFGTLKEKDLLRVEGPYGSFYLQDSEKPIVLLASGTGFAPIKALIEHMQAVGIKRPTTLYWGGRRPGDLYHHQWVLDKMAELPHLKYVPVISDALPEDAWTGRTGFVHQAVLQDFADLSSHQVYACGAPIVVDSARAAYTAQAGLPPDEFFADSFTSAADKGAS